MKLLFTGFAHLLLLAASAQAAELPSSSAVTDADLALLSTPATATPLNHQEKNYLDAIADIENQFGPYDSNLPQHLMGLGATYQQRGQLEEAEDIFRRAMHVSRISEGLYSLSQIPMLERLIETTIAQGDWADANDSHQYLYWLYKRNYGEQDPRMLPAILKLSRWHLQAYALADDGNQRFAHLTNAHHLYLLAVELISTSFGAHDLRLVDVLKGLTVTNYYLASHQPSPASQIEFQSGFSNARSALDEQLRQDQLILRSYGSGRNAIARMYEVYVNNPDAPPGAEISAQIQLADWNLMFNRWQSALQQYQEAYQAMATSAEGRARADDFFSRPVALPDLPLMEGAAPAAGEEPEYVVVSFDVAANGSTQNVHIRESHPEDDTRNRAQVRRALKHAKFRPRFANGAPVTTEQLTHRYVFAN